MTDQYARALLPPPDRERIFFQLNPCNYHVQDNCPSAAQALSRYLRWGAIMPAYCPQQGQAFILVQPTSFSAPSISDIRSARAVLRQRGIGNPSAKRVQLVAIIELVRRGRPGNHVVIECVRPQSSTMARFHYATLVRLGPPEDDVFYADCSRPDARLFFPSQSGTPPGGWPNTIEGFLLYQGQQIRSFGYTRGPFEVRPQPIQQGWRSGGIPKQSRKTTAPITSYRPTDNERGLWDRK